jgi:hypothetical protein
MTRIVTMHYRYKPPPRKKQAVPLAGPAVVTPKRKCGLLPTEGTKLKPASAIVRKTKPCNDNRPDVLPQNKPAAIVRTAQPSRATPKMPEDNPTPAIVTTTSRKRRISDGPAPPMELPLSRKPVERDGDDYKRLKAAWHGGCAANDRAALAQLRQRAAQHVPVSRRAVSSPASAV